MKNFNYFMPKTVEEAVDILSKKKDSVSIVSGGTDLILEINEGHNKSDNIVDISKIESLKYITSKDGIVHVGARITFDDIERSQYVKKNVGALWGVARYVGSPQIRNLGTIGGNVVHASVAGDSPTVFLALEASVLLRSLKGERVVTLADFNNEGRKGCKIESDEILVEVFFKEPNKNTKTGYSKLSRRNALGIVVVATACLIEKDENDICTKANVTMGGVSLQPVRLTKIEEALISKKVSKEQLYKTLDLFTEAVSSISNRPSAEYKRMSVRAKAQKMFDQVLRDFA